MNVIKGDLWDHMWFVYEIIGIYLVMPVIHNFMQQGTRNILILTALLFVFNILFYQTNEYFRVGVNIPFTGYLFYICFGGAVAKLKVNKKLAYLAYLTGIVSLIYIIICSEKQQMGYKDWAVCAMAMSVFVAVSEMEIKSNKAIHCIAKCTWGIYLIHPFFINVIIKLIKIDLLTSSPYIKLFLFAVVVSLISFISTYILRKIPLVKKLF